jgi:AP-3 complex subunit sigma
VNESSRSGGGGSLGGLSFGGLGRGGGEGLWAGR